MVHPSPVQARPQIHQGLATILHPDPKVGAYLRRFLREAFPRLGEVRIDAEWTGVLGFTRDKKPLVGRVRPNVFAGVGFCGHGMPQCTGVGKALAQMVAGAEDSEVHPFVRGAADVGRVLSK